MIKKPKRTVGLAIIIAVIMAVMVAFLILKIPTRQNQSQAQSFIGLSREEAREKAQKEGYRYTEGSVDGKPNAIDAMFDPNRITVTIEKDKVVDAEFDGDK